MNIKNIKILTFIVSLISATSAFADRWEPQRVFRAANEVSRTAREFFDAAVENNQLARFARDAERLSVAADRFADAVEGGRNLENSIEEYRGLERSFFSMEETFQRSHRVEALWNLKYQWYKVLFNFYQLDWLMVQIDHDIQIGVGGHPGGGGRPGGRPGVGRP
jgi:hypothetical protein